MAQPSAWLWGLAPLALLWGAGNLFLADGIEQDVGRRALAVATRVAAAAPGARPIAAQVIGRDVVISGEALTSDGASKAMAEIGAELSVRRVLGGLSQVVPQKPYSWSAVREGQTVVLGGFAPDEATIAANVGAATAAIPGLRIEDRQTLAFGAPTGFAAMTAAMLAELAKVSTGKVALDDTRFCIEGKAVTSEAFLSLQDAETLKKPGFQSVACNLEPPLAAPYRWSIELDPQGGVTVGGFYPSDAVRRQIGEALRRSFPEPMRIDDRTLPALGAPGAFLAKASRAIGDLARLGNGRAELTGDAYALTGEGPRDHDACQALRLLIAQTDGPDSVAQATIACPPAPPPLPPMPALPEIPPLSLALTEPAAPPSPAPVPAAPLAPSLVPVAPALRPVVALAWKAEKAAGRIALSGLVRDEAARTAVVAAARAAAPVGLVEDGLATQPDLATTPDYGVATGFLLDLLGKMTQGAATITGATASLSGTVADGEAWRALDAVIKQRPWPGGLDPAAGHDVAIAVRPYDLSITVDKTGLRLTGYLPDAATRDAVAALVAGSALQGRLADETTLVPTQPAGFGAMVRLAVVNLLRLDMGSAILSDNHVELRGLTCRELIRSEIETSAASELPAGFTARVEIAPRQTGCVIDPPNTCQNDLDALTLRNTVMFGQGAAAVVLDSATERVLSEAFTILRQCPAARITIEGHTNFDGTAKGFDNLDLSNRRAQRVRAELIGRGLDPSQIEAKGFGTQRPLVPHGEPDAKVRNRRVQFTVAR